MIIDHMSCILLINGVFIKSVEGRQLYDAAYFAVLNSQTRGMFIALIE